MKSFLLIVLGIVIGATATYFPVKAHYEKELDKETTKSVRTEADLGVDFHYILGQTKGQVDCSGLRDQTNIDSCNFINTLR